MYHEMYYVFQTVILHCLNHKCQLKTSDPCNYETFPVDMIVHCPKKK